MKRVDLIRHLERHGVQFLREGGSHSVYVNRAAGKTSTVPRHREINDFLAQKICKDLEVPKPKPIPTAAACALKDASGAGATCAAS